jgi:hypothetical protein
MPKVRRVSPEEWEQLGLPRATTVISSASGKPSKPTRRAETPNSPTGPKTPKPEPQI